MKKVWEKPKLVVLVRSNPEEALIANCKLKTTGDPISGPDSDVGGCFWDDTATCGFSCSLLVDT